MYLALSLLALLFGPIVYEGIQARRSIIALLDGFVMVTITGLLVLEIFPGVVGAGGWWSLAFIALGLVGPSLGERLFRRYARQMHLTTLVLGACGLIIHTLVDGAVLQSPHGHDLSLAVILHRLPVGLAVWWVLRPSLGLRVSLLALLLMLLGTVAGYWLAGQSSLAAAGLGGAWLQAFVAGTILHVVLYRPHLHDHDHPMPSELQPKAPATWLTGSMEGWGNLLGFLLLAGLLLLGGHAEHGVGAMPPMPEPVELHEGLHEGSHEGSHDEPHMEADHMQQDRHVQDYHTQENHPEWFDVHSLLALAATSAPALLLAYLFGGLISVFMPQSNVRWLQRGGSGRQAVKGMAFGLPLPICSCGVVPLYRSLIERGVPPAAAMAFLIATPEIGLDAILLSLPLLGWEMTVARVVAAACLALAVGWGVGYWLRRRLKVQGRVTTAPANEVHATGCCGHERVSAGESHALHASSSDSNLPEADPLASDEPPVRESMSQKIRRSLTAGGIQLVDNTAPWIIIGLLLATAAQPLLEHSGLHALPDVLQVVLFGLIGLPVYVCATGATPLVSAFLAFGVSPGAAIAFLLTGPATNITTFGVLKDLHGVTVAIVFAVVAGLGAIGLGLVVNMVLSAELNIRAATMVHAEPSTFQLVCLSVLLVLFGWSILRQGLRAFVGSVFSLPGADGGGHSHEVEDRHSHEVEDRHSPKV